MGLGAGVWPRASSCCNLSLCFLALDPGEYLWKHKGFFSAVNRGGEILTTTQTHTNIHICSITKRYQALQLLRKLCSLSSLCVCLCVGGKCLSKWCECQNRGEKLVFKHQSVVLWQQTQPLWTKARCAPVGECVCQHLSQNAGWTLQSRLPTNLNNKQCHPPVSNILGGRREGTVQNISSHSVLALLPLCYDAGCLCWHVSASNWFFCVESLSQIRKHKHTHKMCAGTNAGQSGLQSNCVGVWVVFLFWQRPPLSTPWLFHSASCNLTPSPLSLRCWIGASWRSCKFAMLCPLPDALSFKSVHPSYMW